MVLKEKMDRVFDSSQIARVLQPREAPTGRPQRRAEGSAWVELGK